MYSFGEGFVCAINYNLGTHGELGLGNVSIQNKPAVVDSLQGKVSNVTCGLHHSLALLEGFCTILFTYPDCTVYSWGLGTEGNNKMFLINPALGQLGHGDTLSLNLPKKVSQLDGKKVFLLSAGASISSAINCKRME